MSALHIFAMKFILRNSMFLTFILLLAWVIGSCEQYGYWLVGIEQSVYQMKQIMVQYLFPIDVIKVFESIEGKISHVYAIDEFKTFGLIGLFLVNMPIIWKIRRWEYYNVPYALNLYQSIHSEIDTAKISMDRFVKYDVKNATIYFKNKIAIDVEPYRKQLDRIAQYIGFTGEIYVTPYKSKGVALRLYKFHEFGFNHLKLQKGKVYYGISVKGDCYIDISAQTHQIIAGESGSGKSNLMNVMIASLLYSFEQIEHLYLVDLKGVELARYQRIKGITFVSAIDQVAELISRVKEIMEERFQYMKEHDLVQYDGKHIFVVIDEVGTIGTHHDKKLRDAIFADMISLFQKGRAAKIIFLVFAQKIDATNIPTNVLTNIQSSILMKSDSSFNSTQTIGTQEEIEKITRLDPSDFPRGRAIIKNGITSEKILIQVPTIPYDAYRIVINPDMIL